MIEILVVIAIIMLIVGLVIGAATAMRGSAKISQTRSMLAGLMGVSADFEVATGKPINNQSDGVFDWSTPKRYNAIDPATGKLKVGSQIISPQYPGTPDEAANVYIERFVWAAYKVPRLRKALESLGKQALVDKDGDGFLEVVDPWGHDFAYSVMVHHAPLSASTQDALKRGSFLPEYNGPFFASAGPDGQWGKPKSKGEVERASMNYGDYKSTTGYTQAHDNLYSFDIDRTTPATGR